MRLLMRLWFSLTVLAKSSVYVYLRDNPCGPLEELWYHGAGCRSWITVRRDTHTHEMLE